MDFVPDGAVFRAILKAGSQGVFDE